MPAPSRIHTALQSFLKKYRTSTATPYLTNEDDVVACMNEILYLIEGANEDEHDKSIMIHLPSTRDCAVQCSENEIHQEIWNSLPAQDRLRLELAQTIAERLVSAALLAQSKANISVICLLLPSAVI